MPSIEYMRNEIMGLYQGKRWARRVRQMSDSQVMAIYMKQLGNQKHETDKPEPPQKDIPF